MLPVLDDVTRPFWTGGEMGELRIKWCSGCEAHHHPSVELCPKCLSVAVVVVVAGPGVVVAFTENRQPWQPGVPTPYVIAIVALDDAPHVRLTTNIVGCEPSDVFVGMAVQAVFEHCDEIWVPVFRPVKGSVPRVVDVAPPAFDVPAPSSSERFERKVAITGIGASAIGRRLSQSSLALTVDACLAAIEDAGLARADIDGLCAYPGSSGLPGVSQGGVRALEQTLGICPTWHNGAQETPGQTGAVIAAMLSVSAGLCRHVLCFTSVAQAQRPGVVNAVKQQRIEGELQWQVPFGSMSPANWIAMYASRYMARYGMRRETLGWISIAARRHAQRNPHALYREPLAMRNYLDARTISSPFGLYDCDIPCDGAFAVVVSAIEASRDLRQPPVLVDAVGTRIAEQQSWDQSTLTHQPNVFGPAKHMWSRSSLNPSDVDVALLYDGFTFNVISWLEALGFCDLGEAPAFIDGGSRIDLGGDLPLNPHGGQLTAGRSNGFGNIQEAVLQLRGQAGDRQVLGAQIAAVSSGGGIPGSAMLLTRSH